MNDGPHKRYKVNDRQDYNGLFGNADSPVQVCGRWRMFWTRDMMQMQLSLDPKLYP